MTSILFNNQLIDQLRAEAHATLTDQVRVERRSGFVLDGDGRQVPALEEVWTGPAKLMTTESTTAAQAGPGVRIQRHQVAFPLGAFVSQDGDQVSWLQARDPNLVGLVMILRGQAPTRSVATLYRVFAEEQI